MYDSGFMGMFIIVLILVIVVSIVLTAKWSECRRNQKMWLDRLEDVSNRLRNKNYELENCIHTIGVLLKADREWTGKNAADISRGLIWVEKLINEINDLIRERAICSNEANYCINKQINVTNLGGGANSILGLRTIMDKSKYNRRSYEAFCDTPRIDRSVLKEANDYLQSYAQAQKH